MRKKGLLGLEINSLNYQGFTDGLMELMRSKESHYAYFANVHMLIEAHLDPGFAEIVNKSSMLAADGKALCFHQSYFHVPYLQGIYPPPGTIEDLNSRKALSSFNFACNRCRP
jgi:UDP-N-acetyl-D-mannosaminuronic acid transferase (WecB/TagA/CpsF family)